MVLPKLTHPKSVLFPVKYLLRPKLKTDLGITSLCGQPTVSGSSDCGIGEVLYDLNCEVGVV